MAIEFVWIILGVVYILYSLYRENPKAIITSIAVFGLFLTVVITQNIFISNFNTSFVPVAQFICGLVYIAICILIVLVYIGSYDKIQTKAAQKRDSFFYKFKSIYPKISDQMIYRIWDDLGSPINKPDGKLRVTTEECFVWLSKAKQYELERLNSEELSKLLGVNIKLIPLNNHKHINDAYSQREGLVIREILMRDGLIYSKDFRPWMNDNTEYEKEFHKFITTGGK